MCEAYAGKRRFPYRLQGLGGQTFHRVVLPRRPVDVFMVPQLRPPLMHIEPLMRIIIGRSLNQIIAQSMLTVENRVLALAYVACL
jgi:hypothetical protein